MDHVEKTQLIRKGSNSWICEARLGAREWLIVEQLNFYKADNYGTVARVCLMDCKTFLNVGSFQRKMGGGGGDNFGLTEGHVLSKVVVCLA